jgi:hypothetical protein
MALRMAKLKRDPSSGSWLSRKEIPKDLRDPYGSIYNKRREEIFRAPADCPAARARVLFSEWQSGRPLEPEGTSIPSSPRPLEPPSF